MLPEDSAPQKKKKTRSVKKQKQATVSEKKINDNADISEQQLEKAIARAFKRLYATSLTKQNKLRDLHHLDSIVAEYLQSFMILGYDISGEKICISHASTPAAKDALIEHMRSTFLGIMNGGEC